MVTGIRKFREHFAAHESQNAIIGGALLDRALLDRAARRGSRCLVEQSPKPIGESLRDRPVNFQIARPDGRAHAPRSPSRGEPSVKLSLQRLARRETPLRLRDPIDVRLRQRPDPIVSRNHRLDEVLHLTGTPIVGPQPNPDAWTAANDGSVRLTMLRQMEVLLRKPILQGVPSRVRIVVGVRENAHGCPARGLDLRTDGIEKTVDVALVPDVEQRHWLAPAAQMQDNVLVILPLHEKHAILSRRIEVGHTPYLTSIRWSAADFELRFGVLDRSNASVVPFESDEKHLRHPRSPRLHVRSP